MQGHVLANECDIANPFTIFTESTFAFLLISDDKFSFSSVILFFMIFEYRSMFIVSVYSVFNHVASIYANLLEQKNVFT